MTEAELLAEIIALCERFGLLWHHCPDSRRCRGNAGFPDLVIAGEHGIILAELKTEAGQTSAEQDLWIWTFAQTLIGTWTWRPADLAEGLIEQELRWIA